MVGALLLLPLGCDDNSTSGPKTHGLTIEAQELVPSSSGCRLKVTFTNHTGADLSGQVVYKLLTANKLLIGTATVFPTVPDGARRFATSDFLVGILDRHRLACSEVATLQIDPLTSTVPIATI